MEEFVFELGKLVLKLELSKQESPRLLRKLGASEQETVLLQKIGKYWNQMNRWDRPDGLVIVTTYRFVFLTKVDTITTKTDFLSFPLDMIENWQEKRVWMAVPAVQFTVSAKPYTFTLMSGSREVTQALQKTGKNKI
jgi:hypothetical protein